MSDIGPYGVTQNPTEGAVTANALVGERAGNVTAHQVDSRFAPASFSTAPYKKPRPAHYDTEYGKALCKGLGETCRRFPSKGSDYCRYHQPEDA